MTVVGDLLAEFNERRPTGDEPPVLTLTERNGFMRQSERFKKRLATEDTSRYKLVRRNDIAFNPYLLWAGAVARNSIVDAGIISPLYPTFRVRPGFDARYVARLLLTPEMVSAFDGIAFGSVPRRRRSSVQDFLALAVPSTPSLKEQRRIAGALDQVDALGTKRREAIAHLDDLTQSIFHDLFGDPVENPFGWAVSTVESVSSVQGGIQVAATREQHELRRPYLRVANVHRERLDLSEVKDIGLTPGEFDRTRLEPNDLLVVEGHGNADEVGRSALWDGSVKDCVHQNHLIRCRFDQSVLDPVFASTYLNSREGRRHLHRMAKTTSGLNTISAGQVRATPIHVPPQALQRLFARQVGEIGQIRISQRAHLDGLESLFVSLQSRSFAGDL